jgi:hypothetical protein
VAVVKNEIKVGRLKAQYDKTFDQLTDLIDGWTQSLRRKKKVNRKQVSVNADNDEAARKRCAPALCCQVTPVLVLRCNGCSCEAACLQNRASTLKGHSGAADCMQSGALDRIACRWGEGKSKHDIMEYKMWLLDDLQDKIRAEQHEAKTQACRLL